VDGLWHRTPFGLPLVFLKSKPKTNSSLCMELISMDIGCAFFCSFILFFTLHTDSSLCYHAPRGHGWFGINDRFGIGPYEILIQKSLSFSYFIHHRRNVMLQMNNRFETVLLRPRQTIPKYLFSFFFFTLFFRGAERNINSENSLYYELKIRDICSQLLTGCSREVCPFPFCVLRIGTWV
jgi:hypothetical protein